ncbi:hypothetical protein [Citreimonas salinaria]|uniref:hypothetical protein n=1 Tax=Citreimonas salinaria TaxID=321339 RepID=UPI001FDF8EE2|nr:hypothetical protein [Citreimonas salinaria]
MEAKGHPFASRYGYRHGHAYGHLMLAIPGGAAEFERAIMLERHREGIAKAKAERRYNGRKPTARAKADEVLSSHAKGVRATEIARRVGTGRASVYPHSRRHQGLCGRAVSLEAGVRWVLADRLERVLRLSTSSR